MDNKDLLEMSTRSIEYALVSWLHLSLLLTLTSVNSTANKWENMTW